MQDIYDKKFYLFFVDLDIKSVNKWYDHIKQLYKTAKYEFELYHVLFSDVIEKLLVEDSYVLLDRNNTILFISKYENYEIALRSLKIKKILLVNE